MADIMVAYMPNVTCEHQISGILHWIPQTFHTNISAINVLYELLCISQHPVSLMADKMATRRMPSFTLQPHHLAVSHGIARMQNPLSDTENSTF